MELNSGLRVQRLKMEKQELTLKLVSLMTAISLLTFGALVEAYKLFV